MNTPPTTPPDATVADEDVKDDDEATTTPQRRRNAPTVITPRKRQWWPIVGLLALIGCGLAFFATRDTKTAGKTHAAAATKASFTTGSSDPGWLAKMAEEAKKRAALSAETDDDDDDDAPKKPASKKKPSPVASKKPWDDCATGFLWDPKQEECVERRTVPIITINWGCPECSGDGTKPPPVKDGDDCPKKVTPKKDPKPTTTVITVKSKDPEPCGATHAVIRDLSPVNDGPAAVMGD